MGRSEGQDRHLPNVDLTSQFDSDHLPPKGDITVIVGGPLRLTLILSNVCVLSTYQNLSSPSSHS